MPKVSVTTTATTEVTLAPRIKAQLRVALTQYAQLSTQIAAMKAQQDAIKADVEAKFVDADQADALMDGTEIDGFKVKMVCGESSYLDKAALVRMGCEPEWLTAATKKKPKKPYVRIQAPGESEGEE